MEELGHVEFREGGLIVKTGNKDDIAEQNEIIYFINKFKIKKTRCYTKY